MLTILRLVFCYAWGLIGARFCAVPPTAPPTPIPKKNSQTNAFRSRIGACCVDPSAHKESREYASFPEHRHLAPVSLFQPFHHDIMTSFSTLRAVLLVDLLVAWLTAYECERETKPLRADLAREVRDAQRVARPHQGAAGDAEGRELQSSGHQGCVPEGARSWEQAQSRRAGGGVRVFGCAGVRA